MRGLDYFRQKIQELELVAPAEKSDFYREYTKFLIEKMKTVGHVDSEGKSIKSTVFFANPERAIAKLKEDRTLTLPVITVAIDDIDEDVDRRKTSSNIEITTIWDKEERRAKRVISKADKPINISFSINIWAKYVEDVNQIVENIMMMFNPSLDFKTKYSTNTKAFIEQVTDNSVMTVADKEDRVIRKMIVVTAEAYLPSPKYLITSTGEIETLGLDFEFVNEGASNYRTMVSLGTAGQGTTGVGNSSDGPEIANPIKAPNDDDTSRFLSYLDRSYTLSDGFEMLMNVYIPKDRTEFSGKSPLILITPGTGGYRNRKPPSSEFLKTGLNPDPTHVIEQYLFNGYAVAKYDVRGQATEWDIGGGYKDNSYFLPSNTQYTASAEFGAENFGVRELLDVFEIKDYIASGAPWSGYIDGSAVGHAGNSLGGLAGSQAAAWSGELVPHLGIVSSQTEFQTAMAGTDLSALDWGYSSGDRFSTFQAVSIQSFIGNDWTQYSTGDRFGFLTGPIRMFDLTMIAPRLLDRYESAIRKDDLSAFVSEIQTRNPVYAKFAAATVPVIASFSYDDRQRGCEDYLRDIAAYNGPFHFLATTGHHHSPKTLETSKLNITNTVQWFDQYVKGISGAFKPSEKFKFMITPDNVTEYRDYNSKRAFISSDTSTLPGLSVSSYVLSRDVTQSTNSRNTLINAEPEDATSSGSTFSIETKLKGLVENTGEMIDLIKSTKADTTISSEDVLDHILVADSIYFRSEVLTEDKLLFGQVSATFNFKSDASGLIGYDILDYDPSKPLKPNNGTDYTNPRVITHGSKGFNTAFSLNINRTILSKFQCYTFRAGHRIVLKVKNHSKWEAAIATPETTQFRTCPYFNYSKFDYKIAAAACYFKIPWKSV